MKKHVGVVVLLAVAGVLTGCGSSHDTSPTPASAPPRANTGAPMEEKELPGVEELARESPEAATKTVLTAWGSWAPAQMKQPLDSLAAARPFMTERLAEEMEAMKEDEPIPKLWDVWANDKDVVTATVLPKETVMVDDSHARLRAKVVQQVMHTDGDVTPYTDLTMDVACVKDADGWKVDDFKPQF